jgi:hypothetical protein
VVTLKQKPGLDDGAVVAEPPALPSCNTKPDFARLCLPCPRPLNYCGLLGYQVR